MCALHGKACSSSSLGRVQSAELRLINCGFCRNCLQCRLEANYAHQQELDMIPLMMQANYQPKGWRTSHIRAMQFTELPSCY